MFGWLFGLLGGVLIFVVMCCCFCLVSLNLELVVVWCMIVSVVCYFMVDSWVIGFVW